MKRTDANYMREYMRKRRCNKAHRIADNMRNKYYHAINGRLPDHTCIKLFGGSRGEIRAHIGALLDDGMDWDNYGKVWEIDHITPVSHYDMLCSGDVVDCFNYKNTQPLFKAENRSKYYYTA